MNLERADRSRRTYGVKLVRGPFVAVPKHPGACATPDELLDHLASFTRPRAADLFCGAGGLSLGLDSAGFDVIVGADHDRTALETYAGLHPGLTLDWDLGDPSVVADLVDLLASCDLALLAGGPPCQPFSRAGASKIRDLVSSGLRDAHDQRSELWESFMEVALSVRPPAVLLENVPDMAFRDEMAILRSMVQLFEEEGYAVQTRIVSAASLGVPQFRQRLIVVALREDQAFSWPRAANEISVSEAIGDLPPVDGGDRPEGGADGWWPYPAMVPPNAFVRRMRRGLAATERGRIRDHITRPVREDDRQIFESMGPDTLYSDIDPALRRYRADIFDDKYKRLDPASPSRSITAHIGKDGYWYIHPTQHRTLTIREAARLQTFPDRVRFAGPPSAAFRQIGNAVPPVLAERIGRSILAALSAPGQSGSSARTIDIAGGLESWLIDQDDLAAPWLVAESAWSVIQGELALGRAGSRLVARCWPTLEKLDQPRLTLDHAEDLGRVLASGALAKVLRAAEWFVNTAGDPFATAASMARNPYVPSAVARVAELVTSTDEPDPLIVTNGSLRVAARFWGEPFDEKNRLSDGRIAIARMVGDGEVSRYAQAALLELARSHCRPSTPRCIGCPLAADCASADLHLE